MESNKYLLLLYNEHWIFPLHVRRIMIKGRGCVRYSISFINFRTPLMSTYKQELPYFGNILGVNANLVSDLRRMSKRAIKSPEGEEFAREICQRNSNFYFVGNTWLDFVSGTKCNLCRYSNLPFYFCAICYKLALRLIFNQKHICGRCSF